VDVGGLPRVRERGDDLSDAANSGHQVQNAAKR
jgi:hypothetical protein